MIKKKLLLGCPWILFNGNANSESSLNRLLPFMISNIVEFGFQDTKGPLPLRRNGHQDTVTPEHIRNIEYFKQENAQYDFQVDTTVYVWIFNYEE